MRLRHVGRVTGTRHVRLSPRLWLILGKFSNEMLMSTSPVGNLVERFLHTNQILQPCQFLQFLCLWLKWISTMAAVARLYCRCGSSCRTFSVMRYHRMRIVIPVSPRLNLLHACLPLRRVRHIPRFLGLLLVTIFAMLARYR